MAFMPNLLHERIAEHLAGLVLRGAALAAAELVTAVTGGELVSLELARAHGRLPGATVSAVHGLVNEVMALGGRPVLARSHLCAPNEDELEDLVVGFARGCRSAGVPVLAGGVTVENGPLDVSVTLLGAVPSDAPFEPPEAGDIVLALASPGLCGAGVGRAIETLTEGLGLGLDDALPNTTTTVADALLARHKTFRGVLDDPVALGWLHGLAIVGQGGLATSIERALPPGLDLELTGGSWPLPPLFAALANAAGEAGSDPTRIWSLGLGAAAFVPPLALAEVREHLRKWREPAFEIGTVRPARAVES